MLLELFSFCGSSVICPLVKLADINNIRQKRHLALRRSKMKTVKFANGIDSEEEAHTGSTLFML